MSEREKLMGRIARGLAPSWWHPIKRYKWNRLMLAVASGSDRWVALSETDKAYVDAMTTYAIAQVNEEMRPTLGPLGLHVDLDLSGGES